MTVTDILLTQITDPFRIGLLIALLVTARRTVDATGTILPLLLGIVFVAVIIPATRSSTGGPALWQAVGVGLVSNALLLGVALALHEIWRRWRR